jgi:glycogen synthase
MRILHLTTEFPPVIYGGLGTAVGGWVTATARAGISVAVQLVERRQRRTEWSCASESSRSIQLTAICGSSSHLMGAVSRTMVSADVMAITKWSIWARKKAALRGVATRRLMTTSATKLPP